MVHYDNIIGDDMTELGFITKAKDEWECSWCGKISPKGSRRYNIHFPGRDYPNPYCRGCIVPELDKLIRRYDEMRNYVWSKDNDEG